MERLTIREENEIYVYCGKRVDITEKEIINMIAEKLAAYEDAGLEPEEIAIVKNIVGRIATADYPHNFQRERSDIAAYMHWITSVMKDAKEWWNGKIKAREESEKASEGMNNG